MADNSLHSSQNENNESLIQELVAKRTRGTLGRDSAPIEDLGNFPPSKARPMGIGADEDINAKSNVEGFDVAIVPYNIEIIELNEFVGTRANPQDISGILHTLWRHDEPAYQAAAKRMHVLHIPKDFHDKKTMKRIGPFYQVTFFFFCSLFVINSMFFVF
jgi:hypothetical protein